MKRSTDGRPLLKMFCTRTIDFEKVPDPVNSRTYSFRSFKTLPRKQRRKVSLTEKEHFNDGCYYETSIQVDVKST